MSTNNNSNQSPQEGKLTRRRFLELSPSIALIPILADYTNIQIEAKEDATQRVEAEKAQPKAKPIATTRPKKPQLITCQAEAEVPYRFSIQDPDTLAEYMHLMEERLEEETQKVKDWAAEEGQITSDLIRDGQRVIEYAPTLKQYLSEELCALLDSLAALLTATEATGYGEIVEEVLGKEGPFDIVAHCFHRSNWAFNVDERTRQQYEDQLTQEHLWGQKPPQASDGLHRFAVVRSAILQSFIVGDGCFDPNVILGKNYPGALWKTEEPQEEVILPKPESVEDVPLPDWDRKHAERVISNMEAVIAEMRVKYLG